MIVCSTFNVVEYKVQYFALKCSGVGKYSSAVAT